MNGIIQPLPEMTCFKQLTVFSPTELRFQLHLAYIEAAIGQDVLLR